MLRRIETVPLAPGRCSARRAASRSRVLRPPPGAASAPGARRRPPRALERAADAAPHACLACLDARRRARSRRLPRSSSAAPAVPATRVARRCDAASRLAGRDLSGRSPPAALVGARRPRARAAPSRRRALRGGHLNESDILAFAAACSSRRLRRRRRRRRPPPPTRRPTAGARARRRRRRRRLRHRRLRPSIRRSSIPRSRSSETSSPRRATTPSSRRPPSRSRSPRSRSRRSWTLRPRGPLPLVHATTASRSRRATSRSYLPWQTQARPASSRSQFGKVNTLHLHVLPWVDEPLPIDDILSVPGHVGGRGHLGLASSSAAGRHLLGALLSRSSRDLRRALHRAVQERPDVQRPVPRSSGTSATTTISRWASATRYGHNGTSRDQHDEPPEHPPRLPLEAAAGSALPLLHPAQRVLLEPARAARRDSRTRRASSSAATTSSRRRWFTGARYEFSDHADDAALRDKGVAATLTFMPSEFSHAPRRVPVPASYAPGIKANEGFLQIQFAIGAHGAHPF